LALIAILGGPVRVELGKTVIFFAGTDWEVASNEMPAWVDKIDNRGAGLGERHGLTALLRGIDGSGFCWCFVIG
jgi:hypothetical protein